MNGNNGSLSIKDVPKATMYNSGQESGKDLVLEDSPSISSTLILDRISLPHFLIKAKFTSITLPDVQYFSPDYNKSKSKSPSQLRFSLAGGSGFIRGDYFGLGEVSAIRNQSSSLILGQKIGANAQYSLKRDLFVNGGLSLENYYEAFDYEFDKKITFLVKDAVVEVDSNIITSRVSYLKKDTMLNAVERRHVLNYNNFKIFNISIGIGKDIELSEKWDFHATVNLQYSHLYKAVGKMNTAGSDIIEFGVEQNVFRKDHLGMQAGFGLFYHISDNFSIGNNTFITQYLDDWSLEDGLNYRPMTLSTSIALRFSM